MPTSSQGHEHLIMGWGLFVPRGWAGLLALSGTAWGIISAVHFSDTITVGSIIVASLVVIAGGVFTFRNNMRTFWRNLAEERQAQIAVLEQRLADSEERLRNLQEEARVQMAEAMNEQRIIRHDLKAQLAAADKLLAAEHAKTDLTGLMEQLAAQHSEAMGKVVAGLHKQDRILELLAVTIPPASIPPDLMTHQGG